MQKQLEIYNSKLHTSSGEKTSARLMSDTQVKNANHMHTLDNRLDYDLSFNQSNSSNYEEESTKDAPPVPEKKPVFVSSSQVFRKHPKIDRTIYHPHGIKSARYNKAQFQLDK